jgi:exopolysaccharide production protein ExoZ
MSIPIKRSKVILNIQALRAIAALLVVGRHVGNPVIGVETHFFPHEPSLIQPILGSFGGIGIDIFFVISGFIMLTTTWETFGKPSASLTFFIRRLIRIYPPYWVALAPIAIGSLVTAGHLMRSHVGIKMNILADLFLLPQAGLPTLGVSWTLSYEMLFYIVFAGLLLLPAKRLVPALVVWAIVQYGLYAALRDSSHAWGAFIGSVLPIEFIAGAVIGLLYVHGRMRFAWPTAAAAGATMVLLWLTFAHFGETLGTSSQALRTFAILVPSSLLVYSAVSLETTKGLRSPAWLVSLGNASYSLYLWHVTILFALGYMLERLHPHGWLMHIGLLALMIAITIAVSVAIYEYVERPMTSALHRRFFVRKHAFVAAEPVRVA